MTDHIEDKFPRGLNITHLNICSLHAKYDTFRQQLLDNRIDVCTLSETWLTPNHVDGMVEVPGYSLHRLDRTCANKRGNLKRGGGVAAYVKDYLTVDVTSTKDISVSNNDIESLWLSVKHPHLPVMIIGTIYRPPTGNITGLNENIDKAVSAFNNLKNKRKELYILGDFNVDQLATGSPNYKSLMGNMNSHNLTQYINIPTRFEGKQSILDLAYTNCDKINDSGTKSWALSDHQLIFLNRKHVTQHRHNTIIKGRSYSKYTQEDFINKLVINKFDDIDWDNDVNTIWDGMEKAIHDSLDEQCPIKDITLRDNEDPWITPNILAKIKDKSNKRAISIRTATLNDKVIARQAKNECNRLIRQAKSDYLKNYKLST